MMALEAAQNIQFRCTNFEVGTRWINKKLVGLHEVHVSISLFRVLRLKMKSIGALMFLAICCSTKGSETVQESTHRFPRSTNSQSTVCITVIWPLFWLQGWAGVPCALLCADFEHLFTLWNPYILAFSPTYSQSIHSWKIVASRWKLKVSRKRRKCGNLVSFLLKMAQKWQNHTLVVSKLSHVWLLPQLLKLSLNSGNL